MSFFNFMKHSMQYLFNNSRFSFVFFSVSSSLLLKNSKQEANLISKSLINFLKLSKIFIFKFERNVTQSIYFESLESALYKEEFEKMRFISN